MHEVAIIGAGELGGTLAHLLAKRDVARSIRLIDDAGSVATGKALDIMQASPIDRFSTRVVGQSGTLSAPDAAVTVIADRVDGGEWTGDAAFAVVRRVARSAASGPIVCAGVMARDLIERSVREGAVPPSAILGSAPEALSAALRALVALETEASAGDVALAVLGVPPDHVVVPWEDATVAGLALTRMLDEAARRRLAARIAPLWPPGPAVLAAAAARAVEGLLGRSRRRLSAFVSADEGPGVRSRVVALPVRLSLGRIDAIERPALNAHDRVALDTAMLL